MLLILNYVNDALLFMKNISRLISLMCMGFPVALWAKDEGQLPTIYVEGKQTDRVFKDTKVNAVVIRQRNAVDLKSAIRDIPGVEVLGIQGARQGNDSVNIRGLSGNRVAMLIDGIDLPEANENKTTGQYVIFGRGNFIDVSALGSVDVSKNARGFGLGGAVAMHTLNPDEILKGASEGGYIDTQYNSVDKSRVVSIAGALEKGDWRGMLLGTYRYGHEAGNRGHVGGQGAWRTQSDPVDYNSRYFLTKHEWDVNEKNMLSFAAEYLSRKQWSDSWSLSNEQYTNVHGADDNKKTRFSISHDFHGGEGLIQTGKTQLYWQDTKTVSNTHRDYFRGCLTTVPGIRNRCDFHFTNQDKVWGLSSDWTSQLVNAQLRQDWRYGLKVARHDLSSDWQGYFANSKPTADSKTIRASLYVEGDVQWGKLVVSPGLSAHYYRMNPDGHGFVTGTTSPIGQLLKKHEYALTPRFGLAYTVNPLLEPYFQYTRGFNAPSSQQLVSSWNPSIVSIWGNPHLKAESANNFELGLRGKNDVFEYGISGFDNHYKNFIDFVNVSQEMPLPDRWGGKQDFVLRAQNLNKAHIYGAEAYARWKFAPNWLVNATVAYSRGSINLDGVNQPLNSVMPLKAKLGLKYDKEVWGAQVDLTYVAKKSDDDIRADKQFYNPSKQYTLVDLGIFWKPSKQFSLRAGVNNVFNQKYWNWADIAYLAPNVNRQSRGTSTQNDGSVARLTRNNADFYSAPGRTFNLGVRYEF